MTTVNGQEVVVITGASSGVGRATAREFAKDGACIGLIARGKDGLEAARREVQDLGGDAIAIPCDVSDAEAVEKASLLVEQTFGPIDVWVNDAMVTVFAPVMDIKPEEFKRVMEVTFLGTVHGTLAALHRMQPRNEGSIVQVGSALAFRSIPLQSAYCSAKHAVHGFTESLRTELLHDHSGVRVSEVQLPAVNTPQFDVGLSRMPKKAQPVPPIYQPEVIARSIAFVARHPRKSFLVAPSTIKAVYGNRVAAGAVDHYLARTGYGAQQTDELASPDRPNNLWEPVPGDHGAHGRFDETSRAHSMQAWANRNRGLLALTAAFAGAFWLARRALR